MKKLLIILLLLFPLFSFASSEGGIGIFPSVIKIPEEIIKNKTYNLPSLTILNLSDSDETYNVSMVDYDKVGYNRIPADWISFKPDKPFTIKAGGYKVIEVKLRIPKKFVGGLDYFGVIASGKVNPDAASQQVSASVGSTMEFKISKKSMGFIGNLTASVYNFFGKSIPVWIYAIIGFAILITLIGRKFKFVKR